MIYSKKKLIVICTTCLCFMTGLPQLEAETGEFETTEYKAMNGWFRSHEYYNPLDLINAAEAYKAGYTGKGITVGIYDFPLKPEHPEFIKKTDSKRLKNKLPNVYENNKYEKITFSPGDDKYWEVLTHGTMCSSIIAASKNDEGMHGVAYDANVYSLFSDCNTAEGFDENDNLIWKEFLPYNQVKILSNSWIDGGDEKKPIKRYTPLMAAMCHAKRKDKLMIFAAGNTSYWRSGDYMYQWIFKSSLQNNVISVGSLSVAATRKGQEILTHDYDNHYKTPLTWFTNLALGLEDSYLLTAGEAIYSAFANYEAPEKLYYTICSATSISTPAVSGAAALIQQAFPYLSAKQLADVMFSTANKNITFSEKGYHLNYRPRNKTIRLFFFDNTLRSKDEIYEIVSENIKHYIKDSDLPKRNIDIIVYYGVNKESIIGQGVVDAGKAVKGPAALNARRLIAEDRNNNFTVGGENSAQALYTVDTAGCNSEWSNDISEIVVGKISADSREKDLRERYNAYKNGTYDTYKLDKGIFSSALSTNNSSYERNKDFIDQIIEAYNRIVDENHLIGLHVGLQKKGDGCLTLSGNNSYKGSSVVAGGILEINGSIAGDAWSIKEGTIAGCGTINGNLYNNGNLRPGIMASDNTATNSNTLIVSGDLISNGTIHFTANKDNCTKLVITGKANIDTKNINIINMALNQEYELIEANHIKISSKYVINGKHKLKYRIKNNKLYCKVTAVKSVTK